MCVSGCLYVSVCVCVRVRCARVLCRPVSVYYVCTDAVVCIQVRSCECLNISSKATMQRAMISDHDDF